MAEMRASPKNGVLPPASPMLPPCFPAFPQSRLEWPKAVLPLKTARFPQLTNHRRSECLDRNSPWFPNCSGSKASFTGILSEAVFTRAPWLSCIALMKSSSKQISFQELRGYFLWFLPPQRHQRVMLRTYSLKDLPLFIVVVTKPSSYRGLKIQGRFRT